MATSKTSICNQALGRIGVRAFLQDVDAETGQASEAETCLVYYDDARDEVLEAFPWPFATRRATLAERADDERQEWTYVYATPTDMLRPLEINTGSRPVLSSLRIPFALEDVGNGESTVLLSDAQDPELIYIARIENTERYPGHFTAALSFRLAADLALAIPGKAPLADQMWKLYQGALQRAAALAACSGQPDATPDAAFIRERS